MQDNVFIDTNILVYSHIDDNSQKYNTAKNLLSSTLTNKNIFISTQIISEFYSAMSKYNKTHDEISKIISEITENANITIITMQVINHGLFLKGKYRYSWWDSLVLACAIESNCTLLFSEDMQNEQIIEGTLQIRNPFL